MSRPNAGERRKLLEIVDRYNRVHDLLKSEARESAAWAIRSGLWSLPPGMDVDILTDLISNALHDDELKGEKGRKGRARVCVTATITDAETGESRQQTLWAHVVDLVNNDDRDFVIRSLKQRAEAIRADQDALERDTEIYSAMFVARGKRPLQLRFFWDRGDGE